MMSEIHLRVFKNRSELVRSDGTTQVFLEGSMNEAAKARYQKIANELSNSYLEKQIMICYEHPADLVFSQLKENHINILTRLVNSVTSEVGRAIVGLTILQLSVKSIEPMQSIRLHKGSSSVTAFSWCDGISMRSLDKQYITPILRKYDLLRLNADGFMMTRSLAENYPYSPVYKANIKGARQEWLNLVEYIEVNEIDPKLALHYILSQLLNRANVFKILSEQTILSLQTFLELTKSCLNREYATQLITTHINESNYAARIMEIAMHSLMQTMQEYMIFLPGELQSLSQMRSANKKHGNIGDIEILENGQIVEVWDAKYGKSYLRDELEELNDKLGSHPSVLLAGFVTSVEPERREELIPRCQEIADFFGITIEIVTFREWIQQQFQRAIKSELVNEQQLAQKWLIAYTESLAQKRRDIAPIDEPCQQWLTTLKLLLETYK